MGYKYLVFDADGTLINYAADERRALRRIFAEIGLKADEEILSRCQYLSELTWTEAGLYDVSNKQTQKNYHILYRTHLDLLFSRVFQEFPCDFSPKKAGEILLKYLEDGAEKTPYAEETLAALSQKTGGKYRLYVATNGLSSIQRGRLAWAEKYADGLFISEEMGAIKPQKEFFQKITDRTGGVAEEFLMVGDSLASDMKGAKVARWDCCWINPDKKPRKKSVKPTFEIENLSDLLKFL